HLIIKSHLKSFKRDYPSAQYAESSIFEAFVNYCALHVFSSDSVDPFDLVLAGDDPGIDGAMIFVGDAYVSTPEELSESFNAVNREAEVNIVFVQAKTGEAWKKHEINTFSVAIADFLSERPKFPMSDRLREIRVMFFDLFDRIGKIKGGKPNVHAYYATTDRAPASVEIVAAFEAMQQMLHDTGFFGTSVAQPLDRDLLASFWLAAGGSTIAQIETIGIAPFPKTAGIDASYVATVSAKRFVEEILSDKEGKLRQRIFDENVRDYIGGDNEVNSEIAATISDPEKQKRFGVMNNGVTIVSPDVRVQGNELYIKDFQIINGCQTSNVLFENRDAIGSDASLMIKVVHAQEPTFVEDIVRSTNRQSKVQDDQFLATIDAVKNIERYFEARSDIDEQRLYFERRKNQYAGRGIPAIRIFDVKHIARCFGAMFVERPDLASRYPNRLTGELKEAVFDPSYVEEIYYISALAYYRLFLHFSNQRLDQKYSNLKWHLLMGIKVYFDKGEGSHLSSQKIKGLCSKIQELLSSTNAADLELLTSICEKISGGQHMSRDQLRNQSLLVSMRTAVQELRNQPA
ncbi:MAG TPA: AIPR family protein, partial [Bellilinea sp.]|nr:AIPR family protein [Bellilinea sp.]